MAEKMRIANLRAQRFMDKRKNAEQKT
jgi:hypothetical protein